MPTDLRDELHKFVPCECEECAVIIGGPICAICDRWKEDKIHKVAGVAQEEVATAL